jgi:gamma-glutamylcyclotransferase (GGCT)/AIG2-like uncharacterized protein YtfP
MKDLEECSLVFVYGTLMRGWANNQILVRSGAEFIGPKVTKDKYLLGDVGFPYLYKRGVVQRYTKGQVDKTLFKRVLGELWTIPSPSCLGALDSLEGYPLHYDREMIELTTGETAWVYIQPDPDTLHYCSFCRITELDEWSWKW